MLYFANSNATYHLKTNHPTMPRKKTPNKPQQKPQDTPKEQGNVFDRILKEMSLGILPLITEILGLKITAVKPVEVLMETTVERELDTFFDVTLENGDHVLLHIEYEISDNPEMIYRIAEYHGMIFRRQMMPVHHVAVYIGANKTPQMRTALEPREMLTGFDLINPFTLDTDIFLSSQVPQIVVLAILSNFPKEQTGRVLRSIVEKLKALCKNEKELREYLKRLVMLSRTRRTVPLTIKITNEMSVRYDVETDELYLEGKAKGKAEAQAALHNVVTNLLLKKMFSDEEIASIAGVALDFVQKVRMELVEGLLQKKVLSMAEIAAQLGVTPDFVRKTKAGLAKKGKKATD